MEGAEQVTVQFRVCSGAELPKTNLLGSIDPYVRVLYDDVILGETKHLKNQPAPLWEEDFYFDANRDADGCLLGVIRLELYNENRARQDELVGSTEIELSEIPPDSFDPHGQQQINFHDCAISFQAGKRGEKLTRQGRAPQLTVAFLGAIPSWASLLAQIEGSEQELGPLLCEDTHQLYVPVPGGEGAGLYGGIQYLLPRAVHFKLVTTSKDHAALHLDFKCSKARSLRVERVTYNQKRRRLLKGLRVYSEATLTNLPLSTDLSKLQLLAYHRRAVSTCNVAEALEAAGFPPQAFGSSVSFRKVSKDMAGRAAHTDDVSSTLFIQTGRPPFNTFLQLDFGGGSGTGGSGGAGNSGSGVSGGGSSGRLGGLLGGPAVRPALRALTLKGQADQQGRQLLYDFLTAGTETMTTISESHRKAVKVMDGRHELTRIVELPGAFEDDHEVVYDTAALVGYILETSPITSCRFSELFEPPPEEDTGSEGGFLSVLDPENMTVGNVATMVAVQGGKVVGKMVDGLGTLVGQIGEAPAAGEAVLKVFKAPLKFFRGTRGSKDKDTDDDKSRAGSAKDMAGSARDRDCDGQRSGSGKPPRAGPGSGNGRMSSLEDITLRCKGTPVGASGSGRDREQAGSGKNRGASNGSGRDRPGNTGSGGSGGSGRDRWGTGPQGRRGSYKEEVGRRGGYEEEDDDY